MKPKRTIKIKLNIKKKQNNKNMAYKEAETIKESKCFQ